MKTSTMKSLFSVVVCMLILIGCQKENNTIESEDAPLITNHERIKDQLDIYMQQQERGSFLNQYACSEQGNYTPSTYVRHQVYLNDYYVPGVNIENTVNSRYASWMTNLQDWLDHDFNDTNPGGANSYGFNINFEIEGANGGTLLNATNGNRAYNEFVCLMMSELNLTSASQLSNYTFSMDITVDYFLCCTGSSCCKPVVYAYGTAYTN